MLGKQATQGCSLHTRDRRKGETMIDKAPQVFISYSWTSEEYKQSVKDLAVQLMHDGILVKLGIRYSIGKAEIL